jgi:hypothetical protein
MKAIHQKQLIRTLVPLLLALLSILVAARFATSTDFHAKTIATLEEKQETVLQLTAASTAASAAITLIPGDTATPIAEKLADLSGYFLIVLCAIFLEKYLLTITGYAAFYFLVPLACVLYAVYGYGGRETLRLLARKLLVFGLAIFLVIPVSVKVSDVIESTYQSSIDATIQAAQDTTEEVENSAKDGADESEEGFLSGLISSITGGISSAVSSVGDKVGEMVNNFLEALAVMLVTSCVIPIVVLVLFVWLIKITFSINLPVGAMSRIPGVKHGEKRETQNPQ